MPIFATLVPGPAEAAQRWRAFDFDADSDVNILIHRSQNPRRLRITVRRGSEVLDEFPRADPRTLDRLDCAYFTVRYTDPPAPS